MRYLGIDYGTKRVGLALSDEAGSMGFPHKVIAHTPRLAAELAELIARERVTAVVIGESRNLDGSVNPVHAAAHALGDALTKALDIPVAYEPEAYTSALARRAPMRTEKTRAPKARAAIDASAAALILTSYLSRNNHGNGQN